MLRDTTPSMQNHTYMWEEMKCNMLFLEFLEKIDMKEGEILPHIAVSTDTYVDDTGNTAKNDQCP